VGEGGDAPAPGAPAAQAGMGEHLSSFLADLSKFALHTRLKARARRPACMRRALGARERWCLASESV